MVEFDGIRRLDREIEDRIRVLYIAAWGRSGSTILHDALGQIDGFIAAGELQHVWGRSLLENRLCGCGLRFRECPMWARIFDDAFGGFGGVNAPKLAGLANQVRTRHLPWLCLANPERRLTARLAEYLDCVRRLYVGIQRSTGCKVIVDSSKAPTYGYLLSLIPGIDVTVVQMLRDPRAVAHSWRRYKIEPDSGQPMARYGAMKSSLLWSLWNAGSSALLRRRAHDFALLRYEDFIAEPRRSLERILALFNEKEMELPLVGERDLRLLPNHSTTGNPNRFETGLVRLEIDNAWKTESPRSTQRFVTLLVSPLLRRYGYPLEPL